MSQSYNPFDPAALPDPQHVSAEELLIMHTLQIEALVQIGVAKQLWTKDEVMNVLQCVEHEFVKKRKERVEEN